MTGELLSASVSFPRPWWLVRWGNSIVWANCVERIIENEIVKKPTQLLIAKWKIYWEAILVSTGVVESYSDVFQNPIR